jgi:hypothetical protein
MADREPKRHIERTDLSTYGLLAMLEFINNLSRKDIEAIYWKTKGILMAGRSKDV